MTLKNPVYLYVCIWLVVLVLYQMHLSNVLIPLSDATTSYVVASCLSFAIPGILFSIICIGRRNPTREIYVQSNVNNKLRILIYFWLFFTAIETVCFGPFPILSFFGIPTALYTEWGFSGLHGLLNSTIIVLSNYSFYFFLSKKDKKYLLYFFLCLMWAIILVTRQMLMSMVIEAFFIFFFTGQLKIKTVLKVGLIGFLIVFIFGLLGDLRSGGDAFLYLADPTPAFPTFLPSGFLWVYIYITSPLNNINYNMPTYQPFTFSFTDAASQLVPSVIREKIFGPPAGEFKLVNEFLNVGSAHTTFLSGFGYNGALIVFFLMGIFCTYVFMKYCNNRVNIKWIFILVVLCHNITMSVFVDFFTNLVFTFQIILHFWIGSSLKQQGARYAEI
ncbi:O-antigen polymerase [Chitinophaga sp. CB10]|uniref:O-antigen polymerase n=1 Tax=Chitinophaga sp. CB10 TaxID=1891659 RepID=UPI0025C01912|nr:O-antigen polymerase [Chitinophaga sp. CB10]